MRMSPYNSHFWYNKMKPKTKKGIQEATYFNMLLNMLISMFEWSGLPESIPSRFLDMILSTTGQVAIGKDKKDDLVACFCALGGQIDSYGLGSDVIATTLNGTEIRGERNKDVAWGINNKAQSPDLLLYWVSNMMAECDVSAQMNVLYSRLLSIPIVKDEKEKSALTDIFKDMLNGQFGTMLSKNVFSEIDDQQTYTIDLTDANKIDRVQYISRFFDDLLKRFAQFYGQPLQTQNKSAQTQVDELHGMDSFSFILPLNMLKSRQDLCDNINRIFGTDISVDFSKCWKAEYQNFLNRDMDGDGVPDLEEEPLPETEPEQEPEQETEPETVTEVIDELKEIVEELKEDIEGSEDNEKDLEKDL